MWALPAGEFLAEIVPTREFSLSRFSVGTRKNEPLLVHKIKIETFSCAVTCNSIHTSFETQQQWVGEKNPVLQNSYVFFSTR